MSGDPPHPPPHMYYPPAGQHLPPSPGQGYPQGFAPPAYNPTGGYYMPPTPAQAAYPPPCTPAAGFYPGPAAGAYPPPQGGPLPAGYFPPGGPHTAPPHGPFPPQGGPHSGTFPAYGGPHPPGPHLGAFPPGPHPGNKHVDVESDDSDPSGFALYSKEDKHPLSVKFTNKAGKKVKLFWINKRGRRKRKGNIKEGQSKTVDTYETHVFMAFSRKLSREPLPINGSPVFYVFPHKHGDKHVEVEIKKPSGSSFNSLKSEAHVTVPVEVKFVNRVKCPVQLEWINPQGRRETKKHLAKGRCWRTTSWEGHYWVCTDPKKDGHFFALNYGLHYRVQKTRGARERVVITAGSNISGSSSSSSSSSD
nr:uncharacterized protein LOC131790839 [Pocillopora verrucosa]